MINVTLATFFNKTKKSLHALIEQLLPTQQVELTKNTQHVKCSPRNQLRFSVDLKLESKTRMGEKWQKLKTKNKSATLTSLPSSEKTVFYHT